MTRKLALEEIAERKILVPGQDYLLGYLKRMYARKGGCPIGIYEHRTATDTCREKIEMLNKETSLKWDLEQAIKAPYFEIKDTSDEYNFLYCFVFPEMERDVDKRAVSGMRLLMAKQLLPYMEHGTCTPFIDPVDALKGRVARIYVHKAPCRIGSGKAGITHLDQKLVDVSVGGIGKDAHRISLWMPYRAMRKLLEWNLPGYATSTQLSFKKTEDEARDERISELETEQERIERELEELRKLKQSKSKPFIDKKVEVEHAR